MRFHRKLDPPKCCTGFGAVFLVASLSNLPQTEGMLLVLVPLRCDDDHDHHDNVDDRSSL